MDQGEDRAIDGVSDRHFYWLRDEAQKNFGDYIAELLIQEIFLRPEIEADAYRLIGSTIHEGIVWSDLAACRREDGGSVAYWCCGLRDDAGIPEQTRKHCQFFGARGPLTRDILGLGESCVLGDPGFLAPLLVERGNERQPAVCVPHIHDPRSDDEIARIAGVERVIRPIVRSLDELRDLLRELSSAEFVVAGSLHAAIVACAYDVPFACWDDGHLDLPFKWRDFAASINVPLIFVRTLSEGKRAYTDVLAPSLRKPRLTSLLDVAPFQVRSSIKVSALAYDEGCHDERTLELVAQLHAHESRELSLRRYTVAREHWQWRVKEVLLAQHAFEKRRTEDQTQEALESLTSKYADEVSNLRAQHADEVGNLRAQHADEVGNLRAREVAFVDEIKEFKARERELWSHLQARIDRQDEVEREIASLRGQVEKYRRPLRAIASQVKRAFRTTYVSMPVPEKWKRKTRAKLERDTVRRA